MKTLLFSFLFLSSAYAEMTVTEEMLTQHVNENPIVSSFQERLTAAEKLKGSLNRSFLPKVLLSYGKEKYSVGPYDNVIQPSGGIEASINVFNSGKDFIESERRNREANIADIDSSLSRASISVEVRKAMSQFAFLEELKIVLLEALEVNEKNIKGASRRVGAGLATNTDILDFKQQKVMLNQELENLEYDKEVVLRLIATLLGHDPKDQITVQFANSHPEHTAPEQLAPIHPGNSLLMKRAELLGEVAKLDMKSASRWWTPSMDVYAHALRFMQKDREYPTSGQRNETAIGFRFTMPIFDGGEGIKVAQAKEAIAKSQEALAKAKQLEIDRETQNVLKKLDLAHRLIHGAEENVSIMMDYRKGILSEYERGVKNSPDVLQASQRWIEAKTKFAEVKKNYQFARADAMYLISLNKK